MAETLEDLIGSLEADLARCGPVTHGSVSKVYQRGQWFQVCVFVRADRSFSWQPRFRSRGEAIDYREAALEVLGRVT